MNQSLILDLLENNARLTSQDLADILNEDEAGIKSEIQSLEKDKIICGYHTIIGSLTLAHSQNSQMSFMYGFFFAKFLFYTVVCVVIVI